MSMVDGKGAGFRVKFNGENSGRRDIHQDGVFGDGEGGGSGDKEKDINDSSDFLITPRLDI